MKIRPVCVLGLSILLFFVTACESQTPQINQLRKSAGVEKQKVAHESVKTYSWPVSKDNEPIEVVSDLTAKNYYVVLDCSGSMEATACSKGVPKLEAAKQSLAKFVKIVPADANLGLLVFRKSQIKELVPLGRENRDRFIKEVNAMTASGGTPLFSAIKKGYNRIEQQGKKQLGYGEYALVIVTDGEASEGQDPTKMVNWILDYSPIQIHTIGFCIGTNHSLNIPGRTIYKAADNPQQLEKGLQDVLAESEAFDISEFN